MILFPAIAPAPDAPRVRRAENVLAIALVALFIALAWHGREPTGVGGADELEYRALSQSLEHGTYREIFQPDAPRSIKYPPVFPAWLAVLRAATGDHFDVVRAANILFSAMALVIVFLIVRHVAGGWIALGALAASAVNPNLLEFTGSMLSEPLYILTSTASLAAAFLAHRGRARMVWVAIALALIAFLTRTAGITVVAAIGVWMLSRRRSDVIAYAIASAMVLGGWFGYVASQPQDVGGSYGRELTEATAPGGGDEAAPTGLISRVVASGTDIATRTTIVGLGLPTIQETRIDNLAFLALIVVLMPIGLIMFWRRWPPMAAYVVTYGGLLLLWPYSNGRIFTPLIPFLFPLFFAGAWAVTRMLPKKASTGAMAVFAVVVLFGGFRGARVRYEEGTRCDRENPLAPGCYLPHAHALVRAGEFVRTHSQPGDLAVSSKAPSIYFLTDRQTIPSRTILQATAGTALENLRARKVRFIVLSLLFFGEDRGLAEAIIPQCRETKVEFTDLPNTLILSIRPPGETSDEACAAIPQFVKGFPPKT